MQAPGKVGKWVLLDVYDAVRQQLLVVTSGNKRSGDNLAFLDEVGRAFRPLVGNRLMIIVLDHNTGHVSGISR